MERNTSLLLPLLLALATSFGCALTPRSMARDVAAAAPPAAIQSTLRALNEDDNQRLMIELLRSPEMRQAARELSAEVADGALAVMSEPERTARVERLTARYVATITRAMTRSLASGIRADLGPALTASVRDAVAGAMREVMKPEAEQGLARMTSNVTEAVVEAAGRGMATSMRRDLVPALRDALTSEETARALATATRAVGREAVLGSNEAMTQIQRQQERTGRPSFLSRISNLTQDGVKILRMVTVVAVAVTILLAVWVLRLTLRGRRIQAESERNAASAVLFAEAIRAAEGKPWRDELTELIHQRLRGDAVSGLIDEVLAPPAKGRNGAARPAHGARRSTLPPPSQPPRHDA